MPLYFLDTSAFAKRYLPESGSAWVLSLFEDDGCSVAISAIAAVELASALAGALRSLDAIQLATAIRWSERLNEHNMGLGTFVVADRRLRDAALALGLSIDNPEEHE